MGWWGGGAVVLWQQWQNGHKWQLMEHKSSDNANEQHNMQLENEEKQQKEAGAHAADEMRLDAVGFDCSI